MTDVRNVFTDAAGSDADDAKLYSIEIQILDQKIELLRLDIEDLTDTSNTSVFQNSNNLSPEVNAKVMELQNQIAQLMEERNRKSALLEKIGNVSQYQHISDMNQLQRMHAEMEAKKRLPKDKEEVEEPIEIFNKKTVVEEPRLEAGMIPVSVNNEYIKLRDAFRDKLAEIPQNAAPEVERFYQRGRELHKAIVAQEKKQNFNAGVYGEIFKSAAEMLSAPGDENLRNHLSELSQKKVCGKLAVDGHRSIVKNIFYAVSAFLAAAAVVAVGLGFSVLLPVISWPAAISCFAVGATLFAGGVMVCVNGRKKGTANAIDNFENAATKMPKAGLFAAAAQEQPKRLTEDVTELVMKTN